MQGADQQRQREDRQQREEVPREHPDARAHQADREPEAGLAGDLEPAAQGGHRRHPERLHDGHEGDDDLHRIDRAARHGRQYFSARTREEHALLPASPGPAGVAASRQGAHRPAEVGGEAVVALHLHAAALQMLQQQGRLGRAH
jgi:hypothetical protein